jgi:putative hydrolase of the HAD superfamily
MRRSVFFDVDGVIVHGYNFQSELRRPWDVHLEADMGIKQDVFFREFICKAFVKEVLVGKKPLVTALEEALPVLGYHGSAMDIIGYWLMRDTQLNHVLLKQVTRLKSLGHHVYLATNQDHLRATHLWQNLGLSHIFEDIFYSARLGHQKPEEGFFTAVAARVDLTQAPALLFDDTPDVVEAARRAGWDAALYTTFDDFKNHPFIQETL